MLLGASNHCSAAAAAASKNAATDFSIAAIMSRDALSREPSERSLSKYKNPFKNHLRKWKNKNYEFTAFHLFHLNIFLQLHICHDIFNYRMYYLHYNFVWHLNDLFFTLITSTIGLVIYRFYPEMDLEHINPWRERKKLNKREQSTL